MEKHVMPVDLTQADRPIFLVEEIELKIYNDVDVLWWDYATNYQKGRLYLTSSRLIWINSKSSTHFALSLLCIESVQLPQTINSFFAALVSGGGCVDLRILPPTISLACLHCGQLMEKQTSCSRCGNQRAFSKSNRETILPSVSTTTPTRLSNTQKLTFSLKSLRSEFYDSLLQAVSKCKAITATTMSPPIVTSTPSITTGIAGRIAFIDSHMRKVQDTLDEGFKDMTSVQQSARELAQMAQQLVRRLGTGDIDEKRDLSSISILTKDETGTLYYEELARHLSEFFFKKCEQARLSLIDAYCIYNRARSTRLLSPDDLQKSCVCFDKLNLPVQLCQRRGVFFLRKRSDLTEEDDIAEDVVAILSKQEKGNLSIYAYAKEKEISIAFAKQDLLLAEELGVICRDETPQGLLFFKNMFK